MRLRCNNANTTYLCGYDPEHSAYDRLESNENIRKIGPKCGLPGVLLSSDLEERGRTTVPLPESQILALMASPVNTPYRAAVGPKTRVSKEVSN